MKPAFNMKHFQKMLSYFLLAIAVIAAYKIALEFETVQSYLKWFLNRISPFFTGFLIAYVLNIPCGGIEKLFSKFKSKFINRRKRIFSIIITYVLMFFVIYLIINLIYPSIYSSVYMFISNFRTYYDSAHEFINYINSLNILNIQISMDSIMSSIRDFGLEKLPSSIGALFDMSYALFKSFLAIVSSIYILVEKDNFKKYLCRALEALTSSKIYNNLLKYSRDLNRYVKQYIFIQTIDGIILGTIATIELYLMGSPYALVLGIMLGIVNYIPYFGSIFGSIFAVIVVGLTQGLPMAIIASVVLLVTQQIDGNFIQPRLLGGSFVLSPLLIIISITIGGAFYGILGMILVIPIVAVAKNIFDEIVAHYEKKKSLNLVEVTETQEE